MEMWTVPTICKVTTSRFKLMNFLARARWKGSREENTLQAIRNYSHRNSILVGLHYGKVNSLSCSVALRNVLVSSLPYKSIDLTFDLTPSPQVIQFPKKILPISMVTICVVTVS